MFINLNCHELHRGLVRKGEEQQMGRLAKRDLHVGPGLGWMMHTLWQNHAHAAANCVNSAPVNVAEHHDDVAKGILLAGGDHQSCLCGSRSIKVSCSCREQSASRFS